MKSIQELRERRTALATNLHDLLDKNPGDKWNAELQAKYDEAMAEIENIDGEAKRIQAVLNAIAALAASDEYRMMARIGLMLGVILVMGRAAFSGGTQFPVGQLLGCLLLYTAFFGPSRQVTIVDVYSGSVRTVDHVPAGIALAGAQISSIGYHITDLMEQAFSTPRMTEQGYGAALETLKRVRLATISVYNLKMAVEPTPDADWPRSWQQFIADCPLKGLQNELRHKTGAEIWNKPLMTEGLRFESNLWGTKLDLTRPYTEPTCSEAHQQLVDYTNVVYLPTAFEAARASQYPDPQQVLLDLRVLRELFGQAFEAAGGVDLAVDAGDEVVDEPLAVRQPRRAPD